MADSSSKGKRGERELCRELREAGFGAIRSAQVTGSKEHSHSADIITSLDPILRFEVKRGYEDVYITSKKFEEWRQKACEETPVHKLPVLAWRKNRQPWVFFSLERGDHTRAKMVVGVEGFVDMLSSKQVNIDKMLVKDPSTWKTTDTFS